MELGGKCGVDHLLAAYLKEHRERARLIIARALRWHADRRGVVEPLAALASGRSKQRIAAAELLGWISDARAEAPLAALADSPVPGIADAALKAQARGEADHHARTLLAQMPAVDQLGRWSRLHAIIDLVDPYLLESRCGVVAIGPAADAFDKTFAIVAECELKRRKAALERDADRIDRARRDRARTETSLSCGDSPFKKAERMQRLLRKADNEISDFSMRCLRQAISARTLSL